MEFDPVYLIYALAAASVVLFVEALYLIFSSSTSYRSKINRRLRLMGDQPDREGVLVQIRRERGLTSGGLYRLPFRSLNRLVLQSGLAMGLPKFLLINAMVALRRYHDTVLLKDLGPSGEVKMASAEVARHLELVLSVANRAIDDL